MTTPIDKTQLALIGVLYTSGVFDQLGNVVTPPVQIPGYHVNSPFVVAGWDAYRSYPATPAQVFAGVETYCYTFASEGAFIDALNKANAANLVPIGGSAAATAGVLSVVKKLQLRTARGAVLGPFVDVQAGDGCYLADGQELPFSVTGVAVVEDWVEPPPLPPPPPVVPDEITMRQARLVLLGAGMLAKVNEAIAKLPEPLMSAAAIEWEYSGTVKRRNGFVEQLAPVLGLKSEQLDKLFIEGATL